MKRAMTILVCVLGAGLASAQNPQIIQNTKTKMDGVRNTAAAASNEALGITPPAAPARKGAPAIAKPSAVTTQTQSVPAASPAKAMPIAVKNTATVKLASATAGKQTAAKKTAVLAVQPVAALSKARPTAGQPATTANSSAPESVDKQQGKKWSMTGKRDPFVSPVISQSSGSGCNTGKKCLEIGAINLRGVVRSENGFIAVVTNSLNKAYFLRENDPVFDGYVVKITGDSIVFQETQHDHLGKAFTREVVKKITTPAV
jgi:hypothetical protein